MTTNMSKELYIKAVIEGATAHIYDKIISLDNIRELILEMQEDGYTAQDTTYRINKSVLGAIAKERRANRPRKEQP